MLYTRGLCTQIRPRIRAWQGKGGPGEAADCRGNSGGLRVRIGGEGGGGGGIAPPPSPRLRMRAPQIRSVKQEVWIEAMLIIYDMDE